MGKLNQGNKLTRKVISAIENTPENLGLLEGKKEFMNTIGHIVTKILELSEKGQFKVEFMNDSIDMFGGLEEIMEVFKISKENFFMQNNKRINNLLTSLFARHLDFVYSLFFEKIEELKYYHKVTFENSIIEPLIHKKSQEDITVELEHINNKIQELGSSEYNDEIRLLEEKKYALEKYAYYVEAEDFYIEFEKNKRNLLVDIEEGEQEKLFSSLKWTIKDKIILNEGDLDEIKRDFINFIHNYYYDSVLYKNRYKIQEVLKSIILLKKLKKK